MKYKHLFGPVISRRLGISLGVDVVPYKYCTMDCVYCEVGRTDHLVNEQLDLIDYDALVAELDDFLSTNPKLDYITFSGAGEPLIYSHIGELINYIKDNYSQYKLALITNSTFLGEISIVNDLLKLDLIMPSMDAVDDDTFEKINRPHSDITVDDVLSNLITFNSYFHGEMWLEIFFVPGLNDNPESLISMADMISRIQPTRVQLNSLDRPGTESWVKKAEFEQLERIKREFESSLSDYDIKIEIIKKVDKDLYDQNETSIEAEEKILSTINRRPCTAQDLSQMLNIHINAINKVLHKLIAEKVIVGVEEERGIFYKLLKANDN